MVIYDAGGGVWYIIPRRLTRREKLVNRWLQWKYRKHNCIPPGYKPLGLYDPEA